MIDKNYNKRIFNISSNSEFEEIALEVFNHQYNNLDIYKTFVDLLKINPKEVDKIEKIPFLPIQFFKSHKIITKRQVTERSRSAEFENRKVISAPLSDLYEPNEVVERSRNAGFDKIFLSSGTTGSTPSTHYVSDISLYEESFLNGFQMFYGNPEDYIILALLPSYLEREGSSLVYMVDLLIKKTKNENSGFYLNNHEDLISAINHVNTSAGSVSGKKIILIGVSFALLDLAEKYNIDLNDIILIETGGMKGRREELTKSQLHEKLKNQFNLKEIHSEYGMTELLSQAYSKSNGEFSCPPWMKILVRDINDPLTLNNKSGGVNIIDLANINSCAFIATQDLGRIIEDNRFEIIGRFDDSEIRGCNLMVT